MLCRSITEHKRKPLLITWPAVGNAMVNNFLEDITGNTFLCIYVVQSYLMLIDERKTERVYHFYVLIASV